MRYFLSTIGRWFEPLELLYLAIAIATLDHSTWASAYLFEGRESSPGDFAWVLRGLLIAIAVDLGMFLTSRLLQHARSGRQQATLALSFVFAAVTSWYLQLAYIVEHTPTVVASPGVTEYWKSALMPWMDARVLLLPLALPVLATVYTLARITRHTQVERERTLIVMSEGTYERAQTDLERMVTIVREAPMHVTREQGLVRFTDGWVDLLNLTWFYRERQRGPYKSRGTMLYALESTLRREESALVPSLEDHE